MFKLIALALALGSSHVSGVPADVAPSDAWCGNHVVPESAVDAHRLMQEFDTSVGAVNNSLEAASVINVYFNIITSGDTGAVADSVLSDQIAQLNSDFSSTYIQFRYNPSTTTRTNQPDWFNNVTPDPYNAQQQAMKKSLRRGGAADLNVYTVGLPGGSGYASFPFEYTSNPLNDGIVLNYGVLPGGNTIYNTGKILTHETGHWCGLLHTFQGGCDGQGDYVSDTAPEASAASGCPQGRDTCTGGGPDPINNHMDYSDDE
ncbi:hypothetical protein PLICRDRAFT_170874 [Plicaturopsis crispa FD-325 SS-3]|nr:hypothetical protein PLICRDRAFT_170874 [Plicaturopsis crispa FD-325 SS-3]